MAQLRQLADGDGLAVVALDVLNGRLDALGRGALPLGGALGGASSQARRTPPAAGPAPAARRPGAAAPASPSPAGRPPPPGGPRVELSVTRGRSSLPSTTGATYRRRTMSFSSPHKSSGLNTTAAKSSSEPCMGWAAWSSPLLKNTRSPALASKYSEPHCTCMVPRSTWNSSISLCQWHSSSPRWAE